MKGREGRKEKGRENKIIFFPYVSSHFKWNINTLTANYEIR